MKTLWLVIAGLWLTSSPLPGQTNDPPSVAADNPAPTEPGRLLARRFQDYTIMLLAEPGEPWLASWNDPGQMAIFSNPTNGVVITTQFLQFPPDPSMSEAAGDRDRYMDIALSKYCAAVFALSSDPQIGAQPLRIQGRTLGEHYFRFTPIWGRARDGGRRDGFFYLMLRGPMTRPRFSGETLILTIGWPETIAPDQRERALKTFDILLQNLSFY